MKPELWPLGAFSKDSPLQKRYEELRATKGHGKGKVTPATDLVWLERATCTEILEVHCATARGQQLVARGATKFHPLTLILDWQVGNHPLCLPLRC